MNIKIKLTIHRSPNHYPYNHTTVRVINLLSSKMVIIALYILLDAI